MSEEELLRHMSFTDDKVIFDKFFYENVIIDSMNNAINQKQQLISFSEDKIKEYRLNKDLSYSDDFWFYKGKEEAFQEVLDFVNKGGKDE